ncbi:PQQ-dependent sugar dehydrogenase [Marmoricola sp. RAF53]|uniref:PQQ-dependent sugar dehydrogenase n=1 Tax=Marmoricola sp. RAF53 TaxID=3233059 RepID=UPI003F9E1355
MRRPVALAVLTCSLALVASLLATAPGVGAPAGPGRAAAYPALRVTTQVPGLQQPWDVQVLPGPRYLVTERDSRRLLIRFHGRTHRVRFPSGRVWTSGETGLMSVAVDPRFRKNRRIYTCQGATTATGHDVRIVAWRMNARYTAVRRARLLLTGLPASSGRHGGCRLLIARSGALLVGTGDAAVSGNPQNLDSLGGKVLRLNRMTGRPWPGNPFASSSSLRRRYVLNYGHRNVQGLAQRADGTVWSVEHGPDRDDEINLVTSGGNYGWAPGPGYDESVPMTDFGLPGPQVAARWSSGFPTLATSGAAWVHGSRWGSYDGTLAVAALKAGRLMFFRFSANGTFRSMRTPPALTRFGRLRSVTRAPNGDLLVTTANGSGDRVLRVSPR